MSLISAVMTDGLAVAVNDYGIASTIADDRPMASIQNESLPFVLGDEVLDRLAHFGRFAPASFRLHDSSPILL